MIDELKTQREKEIWNAAINAAELALHERLIYPTEACAIVRSLKLTVGKETPTDCFGDPRYPEGHDLKGQTYIVHDYSTELDKVIEEEMKNKPKDIIK